MRDGASVGDAVAGDRVPSGLRARIGYLLRISRPRFWLYLAGPALVGLAYGAPTPDALVSPLAVLLFAYFLVPANVLLYGVNDVFDAPIDAANPKKDDREVRYAGDRLVPAAVVASGLVGLPLVVVLPPAAAAALALFFVLAVGYSARPVRFKTRPPLDSISNGLYVLPGVVTFVALAGAPPPIAAVAGGWCWTMGMHTFSAIPDIGPDREAGIRTTATVLGTRRTLGYVAVCWIAAAVLFAAVHPLLGLPLLVYPALVGWIARSAVAVDRAYWWFPAINAAVGMTFTLGGLWGLVYG